MQMFLALITYLIWVKLNSRQTHGKHDSIGELNIFKNMYNKNFIHDTTRENFIQVAIWPISSHTHAHNTHSLKCSVRVIALSQRTKHNSQPLKIHYKKLLHNFCSLLSFFSSSFLPDIYIINLQWWIFWQKTWRMQSKYIPRYFLESSYFRVSYWILNKTKKTKKQGGPIKKKENLM